MPVAPHCANPTMDRMAGDRPASHAILQRTTMGVPMRIGLVGYGAWGRMHVGAMARIPELSLVGVVCGSEASAYAATAELPRVTVYRDLDKLLADKSIDLVDICSPNHLHAEAAVAAIEAGKHVLLEKPMATTLADAERVVAAAER